MISTDDIAWMALPGCWKLGDNPGVVSAGNFPIVQYSETVTAELFDGAKYEDGRLVFTSDSLSRLKTTYIPGGRDKISYIIRFNKTSDVLGNLLVAGTNNTDDYCFRFRLFNTSFQYILSQNGVLDGSNSKFGIFNSTLSVDHTLGLTWDGTTNSLDTVYDGVLNNESGMPYDANITSLKDNSEFLYIGNGDEINWNSPLDIYVDQIIFFNTAVSVARLNEVIAAGSTLGGERGYDNGDGSMRLGELPVTETTRAGTRTTDIAYYDGLFRLGDWIL